jgi:2-polyprenyl-3-methyl-5-hydroxy-6-metoxy-1,4-benzoquinol methylase
MKHLDYYKFQAAARGVVRYDDVVRGAEASAYLYRAILTDWMRTPEEKRLVRIAELACGHGSFLYWLKQEGYSEITGVDASSEQIVFARQAAADVHQEDVIEWLSRQPAASYHFLVAIDLVEHLSKDDFMQVLAQSRRVLKSNGALILRLPNGDSPFVGRNLFNDITHVWTYTSNSLVSLAQMHEFVKSEFFDQGTVIRDHRWLKVPLSRLCLFLLRLLVFAATRERIDYWSPHLWARLQKAG